MERPRVEILNDTVKKDKEDEDGMIEVDNENQETEVNSLTAKTFFERLSDFLNSLMKIEGYTEDSGLTNFNTVLVAANRKTGSARDNLENSIMAEFGKFYEYGRSFFLKGETGFLGEDGRNHVIKFGQSGKANIPICKIYSALVENNPELIDSVDAGIFFISLHVCPEEDFDTISEICEQFEPAKTNAGTNFMGFIGNIVGKVSDRLGGDNSKNLETEDGKINTGEVGNVVVDLINDQGIKDAMNNMMSSLTDEKFDINSVLGGLLSSVNK